MATADQVKALLRSRAGGDDQTRRVRRPFLRLALLDTSDIEWHVAAKAAEGVSHAEIAMVCEQAAKHAILDHATAVRDAALTAALAERQPGAPS